MHHKTSLPCLLTGCITLLILNGCGSLSSLLSEQDGFPNNPRDVSQIPNAVPKVEARSKYGNPASYEVYGKRYTIQESNKDFEQQGIASWYGTKFQGRLTSSREPYDMYAMTAAHKTLPLPTYVEVTHLKNNRSVIVRINDRGPFKDGRIIDLSYSAAKKLGITKTGTGVVKIRSIDPRSPQIHTTSAPALITTVSVTPTLSTPALSTPALVTATPAAPVLATNNKIASTSEKTYLQMGAFVNRKNALDMQRRLQDITRVQINIIPIPKTTHTVYRVRIGPLANQAIIETLTQQIHALNLGQPQLIIE